MAYEIEFLSLGNADSIIIRYFTATNLEYVVLIDAGNKGDGPKIESYVNNFTNQKYIDLAINTHPDNDHIGGFFYLIDHIKINKFWIHDPGKHINLDDVKRNISLATVRRTMKYITESIDNSTNLLALIDQKKIPREEPFSELIYPNVPIKVLGPTIPFYEDLLKGFRDVSSLIKEEQSFENFQIQDISYIESLSDTLDADDDKSCENNSSAIIAFSPDSTIFLFTGDAGVIALNEVIKGYTGLEGIKLLKVPHHGSKYNLSSSIIKHLKPDLSIISASGTRKYPSRAVVNALKSVNSRVFVTKGYSSLLYQEGIPGRAGYTSAAPL